MADSKLLTDQPVIALEVRGKVFALKIDFLGHFRTTYRDREYWARDLEALRSQLMKATKVDRIKLNIPFTIKNKQMREMTCTGKHSTNSNLIVVDAKTGKVDQWSGYSETQVLRPLSEGEKERYSNLMLVRNEASQAVEVFEQEHGFDLRKEVETQLEAALAKED